MVLFLNLYELLSLILKCNVFQAHDVGFLATASKNEIHILFLDL